MKKRRIKNYLKLGIMLFGVSLFMTNCNNDDQSVIDESELEQTTPLVLSQRISFNETMHFDTLETKINEINDKLNNFSIQDRGEENEDIVILTDEVFYITYASTHTYTFKVLRERPQAFIENIVLHYNIETNNYDEYLMQYHLQAGEFVSLHEGDFLQNSENVVIKTLEQGFFNNQLGRPCGIVCETVWASCSSGEHHSGNVSSWGSCTASGLPSAYQTCYSTCNEISAGDSSTGGGSDDPSASGGDGKAVISNPLPTEPCDSNSTGGIGITGSNGECLDVNAYALQNAIEENPFLLLEIDCNQIVQWQTLAQHDAPQNVKTKINNLPSTFYNDFEIQLITDANGTIVNMDYFPVNVTTLPNNPTTGQQFTANEFLDYFRRNLNSFTNGSGSEFEPYCNIPTMCQTETDLWNSNNPLGAIIYIDIPADDGVVVCTEYTDSYWYFMTMNAPYAGNHPVSGTRQFGYEPNLDGSYNFFVRGVDRFNSFIQSDIAEIFSNTDSFLAADLLWLTLQQNMNNFVNSNGGASSIGTNAKKRPNWNKIKGVSLGNRPINDLGCE